MKIANICLGVLLLVLVLVYFSLARVSVKQFDFEESSEEITESEAKAILEKNSVYRDFKRINPRFELVVERLDAEDVYLHKNFDLRDDWSNIPIKTLYEVTVRGSKLSLYSLIDEKEVVEIYTKIGVGG